jgi:ferredoxin
MSATTTAAGLRIVVDRFLCFGYGDCVDTAPKVFALDAENIAIVVDPDGASFDLLVEASQNCPVDAITLIGPGGEQIYP